MTKAEKEIICLLKNGNETLKKFLENAEKETDFSARIWISALSLVLYDMNNVVKAYSEKMAEEQYLACRDMIDPQIKQLEQGEQQ